MVVVIYYWFEVLKTSQALLQPKTTNIYAIVKKQRFCRENLQIRALRKLWGIILRSPKASQLLPPWSPLPKKLLFFISDWWHLIVTNVERCCNCFSFIPIYVIWLFSSKVHLILAVSAQIVKVHISNARQKQHFIQATPDLKPWKLKNYHIFGSPRTSAFSWYTLFKSYYLRTFRKMCFCFSSFHQK